MLRRFLSAPRTMALLALLLAAGSFVRASIPSADGTIHGCYAKKKGKLRVVDAAVPCKPSEVAITWSQTGPPGPPGAVGPAGAPGTQGSPGPRGVAAVSGYEVVEVFSAVDSANEKFERAPCSPGKKVLGGGATSNNSGLDIVLTFSAPRDNLGENADRDGWSAGAKENTPSDGVWFFVVRAICANVQE